MDIELLFPKAKATTTVANAIYGTPNRDHLGPDLHVGFGLGPERVG